MECHKYITYSFFDSLNIAVIASAKPSTFRIQRIIHKLWQAFDLQISELSRLSVSINSDISWQFLSYSSFYK